MQFLVYLGKRDIFLKDTVMSVELDRLSPVVEGASNKDLACSIRPKSPVVNGQYHLTLHYYHGGMTGRRGVDRNLLDHGHGPPNNGVRMPHPD